MKIAILFTNIGSYHAARLRAAQAAFADEGWELIAIQVSNNTFEHPWGDLSQAITFSIETLLPGDGASSSLSSKEWKEVSSGIARHLDQLRPQVVFVPGWGFPAAGAILNWCRKNSSAAILMSESKKDDAVRSVIREAIKARFFVRKFSSALVGGEAHKDYLVGLGMPAENIFLGYDAVDNNYFIQSTDYFRGQGDAAFASFITRKPYFLCVTRMMPRKNLPGLIAAYEIYRNRVPDGALDLVICGSGNQENEIRSLLKDRCLDSFVHLPGFVSYQQLPMFFARASALIHPAFVEQWGLVVNEACAAGLPILSSRTVGASAELVRENENGFFFDPYDAPDIANAMLKLHRLDAITRSQMGQMSRNIVRSFGPERFGMGAVYAVHAALAFNAKSDGKG
ncbi:MAG: glycosyltransferase family 4 protein [Gallionella sp.]|nr:glycosyltransferase family 4 protein [Gallionella sp.]